MERLVIEKGGTSREEGPLGLGTGQQRLGTAGAKQMQEAQHCKPLAGGAKGQPSERVSE